MSPKPLYFIGESVKSTTVEAHPAATFKEFVTALRDEPHKLSITRAEFQMMDKAGRAAVKETLPYFLPCTFKKSPWKGRTRENARLCNLICLDLDNGEEARRFVNNPQLLKQLLGKYNFFAYATISSTPEQPRIRIVVEAKDIPPEQYASAVRTVARMLKVDKFDPASLNPVQPMFVPVIFKGECGLLDCPGLASFFASRPFSVADIEHEERAEAASPSIQIVTDETAADGLESLPVAGITESDARRALATLNADMDYDDWVDVGMSLHHQFAEDGYELFDEWSASGSKYTASE
ncbi:MAG: PriCT-2 domain-containing protein, partial [Prosthecobacter sp.]|uniref:PriCT-2 domain-containing protein n=1 Tax=Prosthecobacter sp. TaxID=1965333 RepID=UPI0019F20786